MPTLRELLQDPDFLGLPREEQRRGLLHFDPEFASLPIAEQDRVVSQIPELAARLDISETSDLSFGERARLSLTTNPNDLRATLAKQFGSANVIDTGRGFAFRRRPGERFQPVDPAGVELGDVADVAGDLPEIIGGTVGSIAGFGAGGPIASAATGGLGQAAGRAARQGLADVFGVERARGLDAASEIAVSGFLGTAADLGATVMFKALSIPLKALRGRITEESRQAMDWIVETFSRSEREELSRLGLTPDKVTEGGLYDFIGGFARGAPVTGQRVKDLDALTLKSIDAEAERIAAGFGRVVPPEQLGTKIARIIDGKFNPAKTPAIDARNTVVENAITRNITVNIKELKDVARRQLQEAKELGEIGAEASGDKFARKILDVGGIRGKKFDIQTDEIPFNLAVSLRTRARREAETIAATTRKAGKKGLFKKAQKELTEGLRSALKGDPDLLEKWDLSNKLFKQAERRYNNRFLRPLIAKAHPDIANATNTPFEPEAFIIPLFQKGRPTRLTHVKRALVDPKTGQLDEKAWSLVQAYGISKILGDATPAGSQVVDGNQLLNLMTGKRRLSVTGGFGEDFMRTLIGDDGLKAFRKLAQTLKVAQTKTEEPGKFAATLIQISPLVGIATLSWDRDTGLILMSPWVASVLFTHPLGRRLLIQGAKPGGAVQQSFGLFNRITALWTGMDQISKDFISDALFNEKRDDPKTIQTQSGTVEIQ